MADLTDGAEQSAVTMETKYCSNCKRDIAAGNFIMHEVHCRRNITLCKDCHEPVPRSEMDNHFDEYHKPVTCKCGESIEISKFEDHEKNDCMKRVQHCEYCELELPKMQMTEHLEFCGSRTECCPKCLRYIQNRDRDQHEISNCAYPQQKPSAATTTTTNPQRSSAATLFDDLEDAYDETTLDAITNRFAFPQYIDPVNLLHNDRAQRTSSNIHSAGTTVPVRRFYGNDAEDDEDEDLAGEGEGGSRARRQRKNQDRVQNIYKNTNQRRPAARKKKDSTKPSNNTTSAASQSQLESDHQLALRLANQDGDDLLVNDQGTLLADLQQFHGGNEDVLGVRSPSSAIDPTLRDDLFDEDEIETAALTSLLNEPGFGSASPPRQRGSSFSRSQPLQPVLSDGIDESGYQDSVMAPCEFCKKTFPIDDLILHQSGCQAGPLLTHAFDSVPTTNVPSNNQRTSSLSSAPAQTTVVDNLRRANPQRLISPGPDDVFHFAGSSEDGCIMLPCEFCGELLPSEYISQHQFYCKESKPRQPKNEVQSLKQNKKAPSRTRDNLAGPGTPPRERNTSRRQEDVTSKNLFTPSDSDDQGVEKRSSPARQISKVKRPLPRPEDSSTSRVPYGRPAANVTRSRIQSDHSSVLDEVNSNRSRKTSKGGADKMRMTGEDDYALYPNHSPPLDAKNRITSLPVKTSNKAQRPTKPTTKKFTNSDHVNDNLTSSSSAFSHVHQPIRGATLPLNNNNKKRTERPDSFNELLSHYDADFVAMSKRADSDLSAMSRNTDSDFAAMSRRTEPALASKKTNRVDSAGNRKKSNTEKVPNRGTFNSGSSSRYTTGATMNSAAPRLDSRGGYVPSFGAGAAMDMEPTRLRKTSNSSTSSSSVRLTHNIEAAVNSRGLEPEVSSAISANRRRPSANRPSSRGRAKGPRNLSNPST